MSEQHSNRIPGAIIALSTHSKRSMLILQRAFERGLSSVELRLFDDITELRDYPAATIVCVAPVIDRTGALLDEIIARNGWLAERGINIIAFCSVNNAHITDRLLRAGALDCWPADAESLSSLADWIMRYVRRISLTPKENKSQAGAKLAEDVRRQTFRETVAAIAHQIVNPLSAILAISERALLANDLENAESERLGHIYECAERIQEITNAFLDSEPPDSIETAAGTMIDMSCLPSEESQIVALARRRYAFNSLPETLSADSVTPLI